MQSNKEDFLQQREYEANLQNDNSPNLEEVLMNRISVLKSTIECQQRTIDTLEQLVELKDKEIKDILK